MAILNRSIRNMVLAGIGAAALAHEESSDLLHHLVEKGEAIVTNSGIQNELLHHDPDDMKETETPVDESAWLDTLTRSAGCLEGSDSFGRMGQEQQCWR